MNTPKNRLRKYLNQDRYIRLSRTLIKKLGVESAILITEMLDWEEYMENKELLGKDGSFYFEQEYIEERTGFSSFVQRGARIKLTQSGIIQWERRGSPPKYHYIIDHTKIEELIMTETLPSEISAESQRVSSSLFKGRESHSLKSIEPNSKEPKEPESLRSEELRSSSLNNSPVSTEPHVETVAPIEGLGITPALIRRKTTTPLEFEKIPRQRYNFEVLDIINYWNSSPGLTHHKIPPTINGHLAAPTKTFINAVSTVEKVLNGKFFTSVGLSNVDRVYTKREIITSIDRFKLMATNPSYLPINKEHLRHIGINNFFYNPYSDHIPSNFLKCLEEEPKPVIMMVERQKEKNPQLTIWLKDIYREKVLLGIEKEFNPIEENKIIKGANRLHETMRKLQGRLNMLTRPIEWCEMFIDALIERWGRDGIYLGHLCADHSFDDVLVRFLKRKGRLG